MTVFHLFGILVVFVELVTLTNLKSSIKLRALFDDLVAEVKAQQKLYGKDAAHLPTWARRLLLWDLAYWLWLFVGCVFSSTKVLFLFIILFSFFIPKKTRFWTAIDSIFTLVVLATIFYSALTGEKYISIP